MEGVELMTAPLASSEFWLNRRVLITGHTGFKGSWLALWLSELGARVTGVGLPPETTPNLSKAQTGAAVGAAPHCRYPRD